MELNCCLLRFRYRKENTDEKRTPPPASDNHGRGTRDLGAMGAPAQDGAGTGSAVEDHSGLRKRSQQHRCSQRDPSHAADGGLLDEPRPGAPRQITDEHVERVVTMTLENTPRDATHWSTRSMAKACGLS